MKLSSLFNTGAIALLLFSTHSEATGMVPETSVVIVEQEDGEGAINVKNTDAFPVLLLTTLENIEDDGENLLTITPPTARVEPGNSQRVRFIITNKEPLKTERLKRVTFEGVPPQQKGKNEVRVTMRQNLPVIIRPAGLEKDLSPWKRLAWKQIGGSITVSNPSPYVVRLGQGIQTLPDNTNWTLPNTYVLPGQTLTIKPDDNTNPGEAQQVRISPATTWGYTVNTYDAPLSH
ncbi:fimbria/pilus chaperone family protein [Pseudomonas deceptionensis]|uniref:P pilus assembly protein, chaperone PapD n=1 Tax=Pseudomonas deceptionensis TaxID=882211 RepID=A0A0J6GA10_PSEDM|nr:fimbria/pilus chaperone family protein [Pseudomonas deceptionensis]KMM79223.1 fimbrial protein [Pseudomonas deceptionensis]SEF03628.1 P pilus assembly protein, chaperone PapD [Pseudomonas deceptionensis]